MNETAVADIARVQPGQQLPGRVFNPDTIQLFLYNAVLWNAHKIHFDHPYAREVEGYPALVLAGPLLGDWLNQCVVEWLGDNGRLLSIEYSNRRAAYIGDTLRSVASITSVDRERSEVTIDVSILNQNDEVLAPGVAVARLGTCD
jgi:hydroxyacyl-ACP dehydratase HTD2-like protein with hotdog domain